MASALCSKLLYRAVTVYLLIYRTAKNNYFGNCPGIIGTDFYRTCEVSRIIRTSKQLACELAKFNRTGYD